MANRNYFNNLPSINAERIKNGLTPIYASSQYIIGLNGERIQCIPEDEVAYHAGNRTVNRNSIGIEVCHPDWEGKFTDVTYNSLVETCTDICKRYNLTINNIKRHYDITGKDCPRYYVKNEAEWIKFKNDVANRLNQPTVSVTVEEIKGSEEKPMFKFKNGKTVEPVYADTKHTVKVGSLDRYEECDCYGIIDGSPMVLYTVNGSNNKKVGFAVDTRCVK